MEITFDRLACAVVGQVATLTLTSGTSSEHPSHLHLTAAGVVVNLVGNCAEFFKASDRYLVKIQKET